MAPFAEGLVAGGAVTGGAAVAVGLAVVVGLAVGDGVRSGPGLAVQEDNANTKAAAAPTLMTDCPMAGFYRHRPAT